MKFLASIMVLQLFFTTLLFSECELVENSTFLSHQQFKESEVLYNNEKYYEAYQMLLKSFENYAPRTKEINLEYTCVNYIPGPYAPTIQKSSKTETFDFDRTSLGKRIKNQLIPAPYVFIQFQKDKTLVTAVNTVKTSRSDLKNRLPLEKFSVTIAQKTLNFGQLNAGEPSTLTINRGLSASDTISTDEDFGFKLYK